MNGKTPAGGTVPEAGLGDGEKEKVNVSKCDGEKGVNHVYDYTYVSINILFSSPSSELPVFLSLAEEEIFLKSSIIHTLDSDQGNQEITFIFLLGYEKITIFKT